MVCKCGGETVSRYVTSKGKKIGEYAKCTACGRISWVWGEPEKKPPESQTSDEWLAEYSYFMDKMR